MKITSGPVFFDSEPIKTRLVFSERSQNAMKTSELFTENYVKITDAMVEKYRSVLESDGKIEYKIYIWDDGNLEFLCESQGSNSFLKERDDDPPRLHYVVTVSEPCFDPWDYTDHSAPEGEEERERERTEIINWLVGEYEERACEMLDVAIQTEEQDEDSTF